MHRLTLHFLLLSLLTLAVFGIARIANAEAATFTTDLLFGWGDFQISSPIVEWDANYRGAERYWDSENIWSKALPGGGRTGYQIPTSSDTIGIGWRRASNETVNPAANLIFQLQPSGNNGTHYQYLALKGLKQGGWACLLTRLPLNRSCGAVSEKLQPGDQVTFKLDYIRMSDYDSVKVTYRLRVRSAGEFSWRTLSPSSAPFSAEVSHTIGNGASAIIVEVMIFVDGGLGAHVPGISVGGAHLFVKRAGSASYETQQIPPPRNRSIKTLRMFYNSGSDEYTAAAKYDYLVFSDEYSLASLPKIRQINPQVKLYLYKGAQIYKHDYGDKEAYYWNAPLGYRYIAHTHPEWLYGNGTASDVYVNAADYPDTYYAKYGAPGYQLEWVDQLLKKSGKAGFDGVFIDDCASKTRKPAGNGVPIIRPEIKACEAQRFISAVVPRLRKSGLDVMQNASTHHLSGTGDGPKYFDPFWKPSSKSPEECIANSPDMVADLFQEYAFLQPGDPVAGRCRRNIYDSIYWKRCLDDMDTIKEWNTATGTRELSPSRKRHLYMYAAGIDNPVAVPSSGLPVDPAYGTDGWLNFGLCSYLLGQNEWTIFGCGLLPAYDADVDYAITKKLGDPDGDHLPYGGDQYLQFRRYKASKSGGVGGVVVVNAHPDSSRSYKVDADFIDPDGKAIPARTSISLPPHTGRILLYDKKTSP